MLHYALLRMGYGSDVLKTIHGIEVGRGIAALLVATYHISRHFEQNFGYFPFGSVTEIGHSGVDFFFVLSGFIIYFIHAKDINKPQTLRPYLIKRAVRVFPLYWIMFSATFLLIPFVSSANFPTLIDGVFQLLLLPTGSNGLILGVSWTLQYELIFYLMFALLILNRVIGGSIISIWFGMVVSHQFISPLPFSIPVLFSPFILQFFMGCFAGYVILKTNARFNISVLLIGFVYLLFTWSFELNQVLNGYGKFARLHYGLAFTLIVIGLVGLEKKYNIVIPTIFLNLGKASYSIYLCHLFFSGIYYKLFEISGLLSLLSPVLSALIIIIITIYSSVLLSKWIEIPFTSVIRNHLLPKASLKTHH